MNKEIKCSNCIKFKTPYCPCTIDCMATDDYPYFQDRFMLLEENHQLKDRLQQKDNAIDECIELVKYWKYCIDKLDKLLEKIKQAKGGCDEKD